MSNLNKPKVLNNNLVAYHIFYKDSNNTHRGVNIWGKDIVQISKLFQITFPNTEIIYLMNKTNDLNK